MLTASPTWTGITTLAYDYESRITTITYRNSSTNTFTYNGLDTRVGKVDSGGTKTYRRDGVGVTDPVLSDGAASYTPGLSERRSGASTCSHAGVKNQHEQTAADESSAATQTYDAFGNLVSSSGTWKGPFGYGGSFGYQTDGDSGLKLLGHRYYDSSTGRFLTRDPAKHGRNWYVYYGNNPLNRADNEGATWKEILGFAFAVGASLLLPIDAPILVGAVFVGGYSLLGSGIGDQIDRGGKPAQLGIVDAGLAVIGGSIPISKPTAYFSVAVLSMLPWGSSGGGGGGYPPPGSIGSGGAWGYGAKRLGHRWVYE